MDFQDFMNKLSDLAQTGVNKGRELAEIGKLKVSNFGEEDTIRKAYAEIGKLYFQQHGAAATGDFAELCAKVVAAKEKIAYNNEKIADMKAAGDLSDADIDSMTTDFPPEDSCDSCGCGCDDHKE